MQTPSSTHSPLGPYSLELLQAINNWQSGGDKNQKRKRGQRLLELSAELPPYFRSEDRICFRQIALKKGHIWKLADQLMLGETISSWTVDPAIAENFKGGIPHKDSEYKTVVFAYAPNPGSVVINLDKLYRDDSFLKACADNKEKIVGYSKGIGCYGHSQQEVVINLSQLPIASVYAIGGHSSEKEKLLLLFMAKMGFAREPNETDRMEFDKLIASTGVKLGSKWVYESAKDRVLENLLIELDRLKP